MLVLYIIYALLTLISIWMAWRLMYAFAHFKMDTRMTSSEMIKHVPSVSVCIPARNETHAMTRCLERVMASSYPKLEVIVLDDSSVDDTSMLIKAFAHSGVRFVEGSKLPEGWLGKNHALEGLLHEASGTYILYMDVDTLIEPDTIEQLVAYAQQEQATMVSVLPRRHDGLRASMLFSTLRYYWELLMHRRSKPAVASSAWMIDRHALKNELHGFGEYKSAIQPESQLATFFMKQNKYRFLISTPELGISYEKKWSSQIETSVRLLYPLLGGNWFFDITAIIFVALLSMPTIALIAGFFVGWSLVQIVAFWQLVLFIALYGTYLSHIWRRGWWLGALLWPFVALQELVVLVVSIWSYIMHRVTWKGRLVQSNLPVETK
jgi:glycosyltransferase involved in cell wall biosynthesis